MDWRAGITSHLIPTLVHIHTGKKKNAKRWFIVVTHIICRSISLGLNKFPTNVNYHQMILLVNGGHLSTEWVKLCLLQLHLQNRLKNDQGEWNK